MEESIREFLGNDFSRIEKYINFKIEAVRMRAKIAFDMGLSLDDFEEKLEIELRPRT